MVNLTVNVTKVYLPTLKEYVQYLVGNHIAKLTTTLH